MIQILIMMILLGVRVKMYDTELQNFYNDQPNNLQSLVSSSLYEQFSANKNSGNFSNHKSSIDCISATKYRDWTVLVTAVRNYSHACFRFRFYKKPILY